VNQKIYIHILILIKMGIGDWGLGIGDWGFGGWAPTPKPQTPNPKPKTPKKNFIIFFLN